MNGEIEASVSPITVFELWASPGFDRRTEIGYLGLLSFMEEAPLSVAAAKLAGLWLGSMSTEERGGMARIALVAATANERGVPVCTRNAESFGRFYQDLVEY